MMTKSDYEVVASALSRASMATRIEAFRVMVPSLLAQNGKFNPQLFGEAIGISKLRVELILLGMTNNNKEEVDSNGRS